jgi:thiol-disulfide isomerase/thioredoxin
MNRTLFASLVVSLFSLCSPVGAAESARPELKVATLDGKSFDLGEQKGKWVVVNFWATWCAPCIKELPDISKFVSAHANVRAIGLAYEDTEKDEIVAFLKQHPVSYPIAQLDVYAPPKSFDTPRGLPTTYLIAPDGSIAKHFTGPVTEADLEKALAAPNSVNGAIAK